MKFAVAFGHGIFTADFADNRRWECHLFNRREDRTMRGRFGAVLYLLKKLDWRRSYETLTRGHYRDRLAKWKVDSILIQSKRVWCWPRRDEKLKNANVNYGSEQCS